MPKTFIDLFSGCGGFSLGMKQAGFKELASIDFDPQAIAVFKTNFPDVPHILERDLKKFHPKDLAKLIGATKVDLIVGGPPCQGFSTIRQRDGANSGDRLVPDARRTLYKRFLAFVDFFQPDVFVIENVLGIRSAVKGEYFTNVQLNARKLGYRVHSEVIRAWKVGVPQKRERQLIIGTRIGLPPFTLDKYLSPSDESNQQVTLWEAIGDLPSIKAGKGFDESEYNLNRREKHIKRYGRRYLFNVLEVNLSKKLTAHKARPHNDRDLRDFKRLRPGETSAHAIARGQRMEFPYDKNVFTDRFTRQNKDSLCSTIVAHLSKDGLMFIHPSQTRSLTPRETARIQSFPDWFAFPVSQMHQFKLLGNAVPPLVSKTIGMSISKWYQEGKSISVEKKDEKELHELIITATSVVGKKEVSAIPVESFKNIWYAIGYFYRHLHPVSALENGDKIATKLEVELPNLEKLDPRLVRPVYKRSGWPKILVPLAQEASRRYKTGELKPNEYFYFGLQS